jgi:hypothetical protein
MACALGAMSQEKTSKDSLKTKTKKKQTSTKKKKKRGRIRRYEVQSIHKKAGRYCGRIGSGKGLILK